MGACGHLGSPAVTNDVGYAAYDIVSPVLLPDAASSEKKPVATYVSLWACQLLNPKIKREVSMKPIYSSKKPGGYLLALFLLFGIAMISGTTAQAQYPWGWGQDRQDRNRDRDDRNRRRRDRDRDNDRDRDRDDRYRRVDRYSRNNGGYYGNGGYDPYGRNGGYGNTYQVAQQQGYSYGLNTGASDAQRGQSFDPQRSHYYRNANDGYNSRYGNRGQYQQAFRQGFLQGYREGYQRYGYDRGRNNGRSRNGSWFPW